MKTVAERKKQRVENSKKKVGVDRQEPSQRADRKGMV